MSVSLVTWTFQFFWISDGFWGPGDVNAINLFPDYIVPSFQPSNEPWKCCTCVWVCVQISLVYDRVWGRFVSAFWRVLIPKRKGWQQIVCSTQGLTAGNLQQESKRTNVDTMAGFPRLASGPRGRQHSPKAPKRRSGHDLGRLQGFGRRSMGGLGSAGAHLLHEGVGNDCVVASPSRTTRSFSASCQVSSKPSGSKAFASRKCAMRHHQHGRGSPRRPPSLVLCELEKNFCFQRHSWTYECSMLQSVYKALLCLLLSKHIDPSIYFLED